MLRNAVRDGLNLVEGNRGLFDGFDTRGTHSTAELAKVLSAPVVLVVSAEKITRTAAALVLGCQRLDPELRIAGVILNRVNGKRHENTLRSAIEENCGVPVLGAIPKLADAGLVPMRHLGLVTPEEHGEDDALTMTLLSVAEAIDLDRVLAIAAAAGPRGDVLLKDGASERYAEGNAGISGESNLFHFKWGRPERSEGSAVCAPQVKLQVGHPDGSGLKIGVIRDSAFSFYYTENLELLEQSGATIVSVSALTAPALPELDALYIGGGFPETHAARLAANRAFLDSLRHAAQSGLPIYAECGGLMLLSQSLSWRGANYKMAGVLPFAVEVCEKPQGHGYSELVVDMPNPFYAPGTVLRGHEFHYSKIVAYESLPATACAVKRGVGCGGGRDGVLIHNVWASYTHLHALATPEFADGIIGAARERCSGRSVATVTDDSV